jgi:hypothetical protein
MSGKEVEMNFEDAMKKYHGQMESALYAIEQLCEKATEEEHIACPFRVRQTHDPARFVCRIDQMRVILGDHIQQHDIIIPEDTTQAERKRSR